MNRLTGLLFLTVLFLTAGYSLFFAAQVVRPNLISTAEVQTKSMVTTAMTTAVHDVLGEEDELESFLKIKTDGEGHVTMVDTWALPMTRKGTELSAQIQKKISALQEERIRVPLGTLLGSPFLSQTNLAAEISVKPLAVSKVSLKTEFEEKGINQSKYKIYIEVTARVRMTAPFSKKELQVNNQYLLGEVLIVGDVPESYVIVPGEDVLDTIQ